MTLGSIGPSGPTRLQALLWMAASLLALIGENRAHADTISFDQARPGCRDT